jgi:hypothetical protein
MGQPRIAALTEYDEARLAVAAQFVPAGARVLDLSGGAALRRHLPHGCSYKNVKPNGALAACDVVVMLDMLDRIEDAATLFAKLAEGTGAVVLNCRPLDLVNGAPAPNKRVGFYDLSRLFDQFGFRIASSAPLAGGEVMLRLSRCDSLRPPTSRIAILAEGDGFGDRLGLHLLASLIPGEAEVDYLTCRSLEQARSDYDLVIVGAGNALTPGMITDPTLDLVQRATTAIGIFGTQHRELLPRSAVERLIGALDTWYARHGDDLLLYGPGNGTHLGDWLIDQFPMGTATEFEPLTIGDSQLRALGFDAIAAIRRHRNIFTTDRAALLCALTTADVACWRSKELGGSAEFRSMLLDVFGRSYPEGEYFLVDRDPVQRYRARVHANIAVLRERIAFICTQRAAATG